MSSKPTRRMFFMGAGATLAAPLAAAGATVPGTRSEQVAALLAAIEEQSAIRSVQQRYVRLVNLGAYAELGALFAHAGAAIDRSIRSLLPDADVAVSLADDGTATTRVACTVETAAPIEGGGTLVEMARLQGDGFVARSERRVLASSFVKIDGIWKIQQTEWIS
jgi:hypothetical protein